MPSLLDPLNNKTSITELIVTGHITTEDDDNETRAKDTLTEDERLRFSALARQQFEMRPHSVNAADPYSDAPNEKVPWQLLSIKSTMGRLQSTREDGLSSQEAAVRLVTYGANELQSDRKIPLWLNFLLQLKNPIIICLIIASLISIGFEEYVEGIAIIITVFLNATIAVVSEKKAGDALAALASLAQPFATVLRDGIVEEVPSKDLVPGDVVILKTGDMVPADLRLFEAAELKVNEALLTGEADDVPKMVQPTPEQMKKALTPPNMVFSSTCVAVGSGKGVVVLTGMHTRVGQIAALLHTEQEQAKESAEKTDRAESPEQQKERERKEIEAIAVAVTSDPVTESGPSPSQLSSSLYDSETPRAGKNAEENKLGLEGRGLRNRGRAF